MATTAAIRSAVYASSLAAAGAQAQDVWAAVLADAPVDACPIAAGARRIALRGPLGCPVETRRIGSKRSAEVI